MRNSKRIEQRCTFQTERLLITSWIHQNRDVGTQKNFAAKVIHILTPRVTKSLPDGWQNILTLSDAQKWISERNLDSHFLTVKLSHSCEIIGFIFLYESDSENDHYNLRFGYLLSESTWGKGLGTELVKGLVQWCEREGNIESISGGVETDNIGSIKVMEKNGFTPSTIDKPSENVIFFERKFSKI